MLKVDTHGNDMEGVAIPSQCLQIYRMNIKATESGLYWAIEYVTPKQRVAHLIKDGDRKAYQRPGVRTILPAYRKEKDYGLEANDVRKGKTLYSA